jgi:geranylgeranyl diphosphate synthase type II
MSQVLMDRLLREYGAFTLKGIQHFIPNKEPKKYLYDLTLDYPSRGGKGFRPGLCIATCKAFGGSAELALNSAVSLELLHNAFLIHDDVEDESQFRRNKPTLHQDTNNAIAVNVGDALLALALAPLLQNRKLIGPRLTADILLEIQHLVTESVEGQAIELGWRKENNCSLTDSDYFRMILKKTCWYTCIHPIRIGALIGGHNQINPDRFNRLGYFMGVAFQIQDDVLNLIGDEEKYGKEIGGDILEGKRTLMLIHLFQHGSPEELTFIQQFLSLPIRERQPEQAQQIMQWMHHYESIQHAKQVSKYMAGAALKEFYSLFSTLPNSEDKQLLESIILYMIERGY